MTGQSGIIAIVCGSRRGHYGVGAALSAFDQDHQRIVHVIVGSVFGVDRDAHTWALEHERMASVIPARWQTYGRAAGPIRNEAMAALCRPDVVLAFPGGAGTAGMVEVAKRACLTVWHWGGATWLA